MTVFDIVDSQLKELERKTGYTLQVVLDDEHTTGQWYAGVVEIRQAMKHHGFEWAYEFRYPPGKMMIDYMWTLEGVVINNQQRRAGDPDYFYPELVFALQTLAKLEEIDDGSE